MEKFPSVVADIMSKLVTIDGALSVKEAADKMLESQIGSIIIMETSKPVGIVTKSDLLCRVIVEHRDSKNTSVRKIMSSPLISIDKDTTIIDAMRVLRNKNIRRLLVSEDEKFVGIVSERDLIRAVTISSLTQFKTLLRKK
ncbi:MAG: CBS domain-containing protein [Candidatus Bathyarchaeota archaeon]|nr:CBS domain-containing protein [Candidatus Bathyarchaeota archaeon]